MLGNLLRRFRQGGCWLALVLASTSASAELVFTAAPRASEEKERAIYEPIARAMSDWLGTKVVYVFAKDFMTYSFAMREGKYDIVFDGPHFAAWRTTHIDHEVLVNLPEKLAFVVVTEATNADINSTEDLISKRVCGQSPPQLGTLLLWFQYNNPAREPILQAVKGEAKVYEKLKSGECKVAILRNSTYLRMSDAERSRYKIIYASRPVPNLALTVGPKVTAEQRRLLTERMTDARSTGAFKPIFNTYVKTAKSFEKAESKDYAGLELVLKDMSFGW